MIAIKIINDMYTRHAGVSYSEIRQQCDALKALSVAELRAAADAFGVWYARPTKAVIVKAIQEKIERRKTTAVRCSF